MTKFIKAPFNFVPLNKKVVYPEWAEYISHDIPFSDGESGEIKLKLVAKTPVFVRNGHAKNDIEAAKKFSHFIDENGKEKYFIPGTSTKGMIRNVLEIMSFGKMNLDEKMRFATREWDNQLIYDLKNINEQKKVRCGYLFRKANKYFIEDHGIPNRINHKRIDEYIQSSLFKNHFSKASGFDLNIKEGHIDRKTVRFKYHLLKTNNISFDLLKNISFITDNEYACENQENRVQIASAGDFNGSIIFTGQPDLWTSDDQQQRANNKGKGKFYEFVFNDEIKGVPIEVTPLMFEQFRFIHNDSEDWNFWKGELNKTEGRIPVFFRIDKEIIKDFGLAFLYKTPFKYSVKQIGNKYQENFNSETPDFAECLFGFTKHKPSNNNRNNLSVKGRIQFGNALADGNPQPLEKVTTTLGSPKASYYPLYISQNTGNNGIVALKTIGKKTFNDYKTFHDLGNPLAGWKRYPIKNEAIPKPTGNPDLDTEFYPLPKESVFNQTIRFHNLRPIEIGALLSAITFHNNSDQLFHSLGMGKPLGYGKMKIILENINLNDNPEKYMSLFEAYMTNNLEEKWHLTEQIRELLTMAEDESIKKDNLLLNYMTMSNKPEENEFLKAKKFGEYLKTYSQLTNESFNCESIAEKTYKQEKEKRNESFSQLMDQLEALLIERNIKTALEIKDQIISLTKDDQEGITEYHRFSEIEAKLYKKIKLEKLQNEIKDFINLGQWKNARLILLDQILPHLDDVHERNEIQHQINELKEKESNEIDFISSIDILLPIEKNKGKINGYLQKKGKLKHLPESDLDDFLKALLNWRALDPRKADRKWTGLSFRNSVWQEYVKNWVSPEKLHELYKKVIDQNH